MSDLQQHLLLVLLARSLDVVSDSIMIFDRGLKLAYSNAQATHRFSKNPIACGKAFEEAIQKVFSSQQSVTLTHEVMQGSEVLVLESTFSPVPGEQKKTQYVVGVSRVIRAAQTVKAPVSGGSVSGAA
jgi:hypothetical protein